MDTDSSIHPTVETLQAYASGKLDDALADVVSQHLANCTDCRSRVTEITKSGSTVPGDPATSPGATDADVVVDGSSSSPVMSSTGQIEATSDANGNADDSTLQPGTRVGYFGDYELLKVLGEGGMGIVYKARQLSLNRLVALKMFKASRFPSADEVRRFHNESEAVARLDHPNIVPVFEVGEYGDQHYFSMKLIAGESLDKRSKDYLANPRRAADLVATAAGAIHHAHQRGILHRDLKPANILMDSEGQPHVTDFGLAKRVEGDSELTRSGAILGTPAYMAPEQASGKRGAVTTSTDVYGLGAVLYVLLTGRAPFSGDSVIGTLDQVCNRLPEPPTKQNPRAPRDLAVICLKCLEKQPRRRYVSADALAEDLKHWLAGEPIAARAVGGVERTLLWVRRHPTPTALATMSLVAIIAMITVGFIIAYNGELKRANHAIEQSRRKLQSAYESEADARQRAETSEKDASDQRVIAVNARDEARNALSMASELLDAMEITQRLTPQPQFALSFPPAETPEFKVAIGNAQSIAERLAYQVDEAMHAAKLGGERGAGQTSRQWRARYELAMGAFLAMKVRCYEYNWACARFKKAPLKFNNPRSNAWTLVPAVTIPVGKTAAEAWLNATTRLKRVVDEHPGTELALQAQRELSNPCGFRWVETYIQPITSETDAAAKKAEDAMRRLATYLAPNKQRDPGLGALDHAGDPTLRTVETPEQFQRRGDEYAMLGLWDRAAADFGEVIRLHVEDPSIRYHQILVLLSAGDHNSARHAASCLLNHLYNTAERMTANSVAWSTVVLPGAVTELEAPVRLAEFALKDSSATGRGFVLITLGATLFRAGRFEDAIRCLEEGIQLRSGKEEPLDWLFLAMAHQRLGHRGEARRWLGRIQNHRETGDPSQFWDELEIRLLRSEAEAAIFYDPIFPADPFAH